MDTILDKWTIKNKNNDITKFNNDYIKTILQDKGVKDVDRFFNNQDKEDFKSIKNVDKALKLLQKHIKNQSNIHIIVDSDNDGYCSSAILYKFLREIYNDKYLSWHVHDNKEHGIILEELESYVSNTDLLISPDGGSNDMTEQMILKDKYNIDTIVLDHHKISQTQKIIDEYNKYNDTCILVNNQIDNNPNLCGAGVVLDLIKLYDEINWTSFANEYVDLVALAHIGDMMDIRDYVVHSLIRQGLQQIKSKFLKQAIIDMEYSIQNEISPMKIAFYIVPYVNAVVRVGTQEDKEILFKAIADIDTHLEFEYKKRGQDKIEMQNIYQYAFRMAKSNKGKQDRFKKKLTKDIVSDIKNTGLNKNKIIVYHLPKVQASIKGVVAMEIAKTFNKPCLILSKMKKSSYSKDKKYDKDTVYFGGSGRNIENDVINSLYNFCLESQLFQNVQGHDNAHGVEIAEDNIPKFIKYANKKLKGKSFKQAFDYTINTKYLQDDELFLQLDDLKYDWGTNLKSPLFYIPNIKFTKLQTELKGKYDNVLIIDMGNYEIAKLYISHSEKEPFLPDGWESPSEIEFTMDIIGTVGVNTFGGQSKNQIIIEDYLLKRIK